LRGSDRYISRLTALGPTAEQHDAAGARSCEIDAIAGSTIDTKLPDAVTAVPMVTGIAACHSINATQYRHSTAEIDQAIEPALERVAARWRQIVL
jgi:hypothetical protein